MTIILPDGRAARDVYKAVDPEGSGKIIGLNSWKNQAVWGNNNGAAVKKGNWRDYYDMYRKHSMVRSAIDKIAKTSTNVGYDFVPRDSRSKVKSREVKALKDFFSRQPDFIYELRRIYKDMLIYGDAYLYVVPDRRRHPYKLKRLHPKTIQIKADRNGEILAYYQKDPDNILDEPTQFKPEEILHFRIDDPDNDLYGLSPLESLTYAVTADLYAQRYNAAFFQNSGVTGTIIAIKSADPGEIERNRKWLSDNYTGPDSAHKPIVVQGDSITIGKSVATHMEMGFLEGRRFIIQEILAVLDVPPAKVGIMETANRSNSKEQDKTFRTESVSPLQYAVESVINDQFVRRILGIENTIFVHSEGDTRDAIEQMDYYTKGAAWGVFNVNEIRSKLGMAPVEGGDINGIMSPTGFVPLDRLTIYFEPLQMPKNAVPSEDDPVGGEKPPTSTVNTASSGTSSPRVAKSRDDPANYALQGAIIKITMAAKDDSALRQAYSYLEDVEFEDVRIDHARQSVKKACRTKDPILKLGYIERAQEALGQFVVPMTDGYVQPAKDLEERYNLEEKLLDEEEDDEYD